ncbi:hypothetical protein PTQ27_07785 [Mannheimia sp. AT1]|uniref:Uncharacterized protein n=1 Tax=Mannheimia cairinae TaxID=3025936 RepID=A0ABT5MSC7_9PAST|nr:hypothetical protein [Mannheimia cairinae]MDD0824361.1 hypothetical protein [Mannheimia cairinae]MDD0826516.1 hypothetical protein [Mannheimia cairinae]
MKYLKKVRKRWQLWQFYRQQPELKTRHNLLREAIKQGIENPVGRARKGRT